MSICKVTGVLSTFLCLIVAVAVGLFFLGEMDRYALAGLAQGAFSSAVNYLLLIEIVKSLSNNRYFLAVQLYILRLLIYLLAAFLSVRLGIVSTIAFSSAIIAISIAIAVVFVYDETKKTKKEI